MYAEIVVMRIVHVLGAIIWVGTSLFLGIFLFPALANSGPAGGAVMGALARRKLFEIIPVIAVVTMLAGLRLLWIMSQGYSTAYFETRGGRTYALGALTAIAAFVLFMSVSHPALRRALALGQRMAQASEAERGALAAELRALQERGARAGAISGVLLLTTAVAMAIGRYV